MNGNEYRHLDGKIDGLERDLVEVKTTLARIDTRINTVWKVFSVLGAIATAIAGWLGLQ